jgi:hypothetical protein
LGWYEIFDDASTGFAHVAWRQVSWPGYIAKGDGATHPAVRRVDGTSRGEIVLGLGAGSNGWLEIVTGSDANYRHHAWIQVAWANYNVANGTSFPAAGDVDGDGLDEIVVGLGRGGGGWVELFDDAAHGFALAKWLRASIDDYPDGETHPAVGDLDDDEVAEIVIGLAVWPGNGGWFETLDDGVNGFVSLGWRNLGWTPYQRAGGATYPAIGKFK